MWPTNEEIARLARQAAWAHQSRLLSFDRRVEAAHDGIVEALASGGGDLSQAARLAITAATVAMHQLYGIPRGDRHTGRNFQVYWAVKAEPWGFADDLVETTAVRQIWAALPERHRQTLRTLAVAGSVAGTADALGISYAAASWRIDSARRAAKRLWFEPDVPPRHWHRCAGGEKITPARQLAAVRRWRQKQNRDGAVG